MSRTVSKILAICAMVVVIPLMIVGTAFVAFFATERTVNVNTYIVDDVHAVNYLDENNVEVKIADPQFQYGEKLYSSHKITAPQSKTVEISAQDSVAYEFQGWFAGDVKQYKEAAASAEGAQFAAKTLALNLDMQKAADEYVAVYSVVRYNIAGWSYKADPEKGGETEEAPAEAKSSYIYGEKLPVLTYTASNTENPQYTFAGWIVKDGVKNPDGTPRRYKNATFVDDGTEGLVLTNPWADSKYATIKFFGQDGSEIAGMSKQIRVGESFTLPNARETSKDADKAGYEYYWTSDAEGQTRIAEVTPTNEDAINVYLHKAALTYTVQLVESDANYNQEGEITFTRDAHENLDKVFQAENWTIANQFWEFDGINWNGTKYASAEEFVKAFVAANPAESSTATLTANVIKNYTKFSVNTLEYYTAESDVLNPDKKMQEHTISGDTDAKRPYTGEETSLTLGDIFGLSKTTSGEWYAKKDNKKHKTSLREIQIEISDDLELTFDVEGVEGWETMTLDELLNSLVTEDVKNQIHIIDAIKTSDAVIEKLQIERITGIYNILEEVVENA